MKLTNGTEIIFYKGKYPNGCRAVCAYDVASGELYADITINLPDLCQLPEDDFSFFSADCTDIYDEMVRQGYIAPGKPVKYNMGIYQTGRFLAKFDNEAKTMEDM